VLKRVLVVTRSLILSAKPDGKVAREGKLSDLREVRATTRTQLLIVHKQWVLEAESNNTPLLLLQLRRLCAHAGINVKFDVCRDAQMSAAKVFDTAGYSLKEGYLYKQGGNVKNWKSRWFVLNATSLNYFETEKDSRGTSKPLGSILVSSIEAATIQACTATGSPPHSGNFCLQFQSAGRDWLFCATSQRDRDDWLRVMTALVNPKHQQQQQQQDPAGLTPVYSTSATQAAAASAAASSSPAYPTPAYPTSMPNAAPAAQQQQQQQVRAVPSSPGHPGGSNTPPPAASRPAAAKPQMPLSPRPQHQQLPHQPPQQQPPQQQQQHQQKLVHQQPQMTHQKMHFGIEKLQEMFPDEPPSVLQAALTSFEGDTQRAIDVLLQRQEHRMATARQPKPRPRRSSSFSGQSVPKVFTSGGQAPLPVFHRERSPSEIAVIMERMVDPDDDLADIAPAVVYTAGGIHYEELPNNAAGGTAGSDPVVYESLPPTKRSTSDPPLPMFSSEPAVFKAPALNSSVKASNTPPPQVNYTTLPRDKNVRR
jgi:hypothetical protein